MEFFLRLFSSYRLCLRPFSIYARHKESTLSDRYSDRVQNPKTLLKAGYRCIIPYPAGKRKEWYKKIMHFLKKKLPHKATPTELSEVHARLDAQMCGLTQEWALESLGVERLLPLINIADNEKMGKSKSILYAYRFGYLNGKEHCDDSLERECRQKILGIINQIDSLEHLRIVYTTAKVYLKKLTEDEKGDTHGKVL